MVLIVDCTEYGVGSAPHAVVRNAMHSVYKGRLTCKVLYGMGPDGSTYYVSEGFDGSTTDIDVVKNSGFLDLLRQFLRQAEEMGRDLKARPLRILADRGFPLQALIDTELGGGIEGSSCVSVEVQVAFSGGGGGVTSYRFCSCIY